MVVTRFFGLSGFESVLLSPFGLARQGLSPIFSTNEPFVVKVGQAADAIVSAYFFLLCCVVPGALCLLLANRSRFRLPVRGIPPLAGALALWHLGLICLLSGITLFFSGGGFLKSVLGGSLVGGFGLKVLPAGSEAFAKAKQRMLRRSHELLSPDRPTPILYLRPFLEDETVPSEELTRNYDTGRGLSLAFYTDQRKLTFEEMLCDGLGSVAPVIALERPGTSSLSVGAARMKVASESWQQEITNFVSRCRFAAMVVGCSPGLLWELGHITSTQPFSKLLLILPGESSGDFWSAFIKFTEQIRCLAGLPPSLPPSALAVAFRPGWRPVLLTGPRTSAGFARVAQWMDGLKPSSTRNCP
jgi:hypothetical protein